MNKGAAFIKIFISVLLLAFLGYQTYSVIYKPITTATAVYYDAFDGIEINGYFVREEKLINYTATGNERYVAKEGEKVSKGGIVAEVYSDSSTALAYSRAEELEKQIETLKTMNSVSDPSSVDLDTISNKIKKEYTQYLFSTDNGGFLNSDAFANELLIQMNRKQILTGEVQGFDAMITSLEGQLASVKNGLGAPINTIKAEASGFFVSNIDGFESLLNINNIDNLNTSIFDKLNSTKPGNGFGKIVTSYDWFIVSKMTGDDYLRFSPGDSVSLKTTIEGSEELNATVYRVNVDENKNEAVVIFSCNIMNGNIAITRNAKMTVVTKSYSGIRISNKAIRVVDGQTGVYIIQGSIVKFRPVEIIYTTETFSLCKRDESNLSDAIRLYDEVIEKGKNLYDGKYIN